MLYKQWLKNPTDAQIGEFKTSAKHLECQQTIADKMKEWIKSGAISFVGDYAEVKKSFPNSPVHTLLPLSVERNKPRLCADGGAPKSISPDKIECKLGKLIFALF